MLAALALTALSSLAQAPSNSELRTALDALRETGPGEARFEAAKARLPELLASRSDVFVEGAAYLVGIHGLAEFAPDLVAALRAQSERTKDPSTKAYSLLLDALIQLEHAAPAELILARASEEHAELVYLALGVETDEQRAADNLARFVALGLRSESAYWAAAIELTLARDPRIAEELLVGAPWELELGVRDSGSDTQMGRVDGQRIRSWAHPQWPPFVSYRLDLPAPNGALAELRHTRSEHTRSAHSQMGPGLAARRDWRLRLLRELSAQSTPPPVDQLELYVDDPRTISAAVDERVKVLRASLDRLVRQFAEAGLIVDSEKLRKRIHFTVELRDLRAERTPPLAAPADTESVRYLLR